MKHFVIAVYDSALGSFMPPFNVPALGSGIRSFQDEVNREDSMLGKHPRDFKLFHIAMFDDTTGNYENLEPIVIADAAQLHIVNVEGRRNDA